MHTNLTPFFQASLPSVAIPCTVKRLGKVIEDQNCFITALWLRELRMQSLSAFAGIDDTRMAALDYLQSASVCHSTLGHLWGFWPANGAPTWAKSLGPDLDDTCVVLNELIVADQVCVKTLKPKFYRLLARQRVSNYQANQTSWVKSGSYLTWIKMHESQVNSRDRSNGNVIDACVNTNVVALLATMNAKSAPGYQAACETILAAIEWAAERPARLRAISPYYPNAIELKRALQHAIDCGAHELQSAIDAFLSIEASHLSDFDEVICAGAYGHPVWHCDAIQQLRRNPFNMLTPSKYKTGRCA